MKRESQASEQDTSPVRTPFAFVDMAVAEERLRKARTESNALSGFCQALRIDPTQTESCVIYLTHLLETEQLSTAQLDRRVSLIDLARRVDGLLALRADPHFRLFLRGLLRTARLHYPREQSDPLYREHLDALIEQTLRPTSKQTRLRAAVLLLHHTGWPPAAVSRLKWCDLDLRRANRTIVRWPIEVDRLTREPLVIAHPNRPPTLRVALDRARAIPVSSPYVTWPPGAYHPNQAPFLVVKAQRALEAADGDSEAALLLVSTSPEQIRNRAALVLGFGAALTTKEALTLRQGDVNLASNGLLIAVPGRRTAVGVPIDPGTLHDPIRAWEAWLAELASWDLRHNTAPALLDAHKLGVHPHVIGERGLNQLVQRPASALGLRGTFSWQSLRWGAIRTAIRDNERTHHVASLAATRLDTIGRHQHREQLITHSVAGQLGL